MCQVKISGHLHLKPCECEEKSFHKKMTEIRSKTPYHKGFGVIFFEIPVKIDAICFVGPQSYKLLG